MRLIEDAAGIRGREVIPRVIPVADPAIGSDWSLNVPGGVLWYVESIKARITTSATVASRRVAIVVTDGSLEVFRVGEAANLTAGVTANYNWLRNVATQGAASFTNGVLRTFPSVPILGGWSIGTSTENMDPNDHYNLIVLYVLEIEERPYDVELARDLATMRGNTSNAYPEIREGL